MGGACGRTRGAQSIFTGELRNRSASETDEKTISRGKQAGRKNFVPPLHTCHL